MAKKITFKDIMGGGWIIDKAMQGYNGEVRITAHRRHREADGVNRYQEWLKISYVNRVRREAGYVPIQEHPAWTY